MKLSLLFLSSLAAAAPSGPSGVEPRQLKSLCEQYGYWSGNGYEVLNNLWGKDAATSGSQCTYVNGASNNGIQWSSKWNWNGGPNNVKSYVYAGRQIQRGRKISSISSMPTSINWSYDTENVRANVAYDVFTAADPEHVNSSGDYELMIWLARLGDVYPIGQSSGQVTVAGRTWDLWIGYNGAMRVYSFIAASPVRSFTADVKEFFRHLEKTQNYPSSQQNLIGMHITDGRPSSVFQVGTEAFTGGPATFSVSQFSASVN
ncbi:glycoside hydrolase family 12 protein [Chaetomidium leptoderma]|uniref:Glycoside hydrolase family 12 protein n=1 Tax=Chaetomidium leptoderma TaxID=669021 RepID=A0AAN6ZYB1_9PEZI|nr:glycoside hydrolase family 12 protein [Chaetomidium leptoderma]